MEVMRFNVTNPTKAMQLAHHYDTEQQQQYLEEHQAEIRSLMADQPHILATAEARAAQGIECKFCGMDTHTNLLGSIPTLHNEATCKCVNQQQQSLEPWRLLRAHGNSSESIHMILESIRTKGAYKTKPNLFNDFAKAVEVEQERREKRKQEWILNNRQSVTPSTTRYGPYGSAGR